jgi:hypothetical protein
MLKKIVYVGFSVFLSYITYDLVLELWAANPSRYDLLESVVIAFLLVLFETGIFAYVGFIFPTSKLLPSQYYEVSNPRVIRRLYKIFGVVHFKKLLMVLFWGYRRNRRKYFDGTRSGIDGLMYQAQQSEFGHLAAAVLVTLTGLTLLVRGYRKCGHPLKLYVFPRGI